MRLMANPLRIVRPRRPAQVSICPVCVRPVTESDDRSRLRGDTYAHRACSTYTVRTLSANGGYRGARRGSDRRGDATE